ncbi:hypothetical protein NHF50_14970 [Flavobacterium sp. NRK F10]|uniref:Uncharacterized protein n=1 Tax=Flavobacterium sediminis TaxID=2201181 RepID=A0A2U8QYD2_9FLAO|nr:MULTISPECIES: hypothetical protein [Flavobacterium]AWM15071.1 hypothetical protein DI487_15230 [Flavobacterium sediminis]MCO6176351.1 hypothetical protein [Flavobacterium sp. NRK F10]
MLLLLVFAVITFLVALGLVKLIDKFLPRNARFIVSIVLWAVCGVLTYLIYASVMKPINFEKAKNERYEIAVKKLLDIKKAELGYKTLHGKYTDSFDELVRFVENDKFPIISRKDTAVIDAERNAAFRITTDATGKGGFFKDVVIIDTLGYISVKDSLFKNTDRYKRLNEVKIDELTVPITLQTGEVERSDIKMPVFQAVIDKNAILKGLDEELIEQENRVESIEEINGDEIKLGSLEDVTVTGNWPKKYGNNE